ncbi:MAG: hypothetical protein GX621_17095 [Pirellulaceae bacterium]|nr:hypothetical protein [Pirellulaceae bacterium]
MKRLRCADVFAVVAIVAILSVLAWGEYGEWQARRRHELRVEAFDESKVSPVVLPADRIVENESLAGRWVKTVGRGCRSELVFEAPAEGADRSYRVEFATRTCTSHQRDQRTAEYSDGQVTLDRPVADSIGPVYRRLHSARVGSKRILVPETQSDTAADLDAAIEKAEKHGEWRNLEALAYVRQDGDS